jgi:hypothetical protein
MGRVSVRVSFAPEAVFVSSQVTSGHEPVTAQTGSICAGRPTTILGGLTLKSFDAVGLSDVLTTTSNDLSSTGCTDTPVIEKAPAAGCGGEGCVLGGGTRLSPTFRSI